MIKKLANYLKFSEDDDRTMQRHFLQSYQISINMNGRGINDLIEKILCFSVPITNKEVHKMLKTFIKLNDINEPVDCRRSVIDFIRGSELFVNPRTHEETVDTNALILNAQPFTIKVITAYIMESKNVFVGDYSEEVYLTKVKQEIKKMETPC